MRAHVRRFAIATLLAATAAGIAFAATRTGEEARASTSAPAVDWALAPGTSPAPNRVAPRTAPLATLSPNADRSLASLGGDWGVAVIDPRESTRYEANAEQYFPLASVTKVVILVTLLGQAQDAHRALTAAERDMATRMITVSDNDAAIALWERIGGAAGMQAYLDRTGLQGIRPAPPDHSWGDTEATPRGIATLLVRLSGGELLDKTHRAFALALMTAVTEEQRWGASAAFAGSSSIAIKNGWYPAEDGWRVASAAFAPDARGRPLVVVVLAEHQPDFESAVATIEQVAGAIGASAAGS